MAEGLISRGGSGNSYLFNGMTMDQYNDLIKEMIQEGTGNFPKGANLFESNGTFIAPYTTSYNVILIGGGGGGGGWIRHGASSSVSAWGGGGGSGYLNAGLISLNKGDNVEIIIGTGGNYGYNEVIRSGFAGSGTSGGITKFGNYLSATGGTGGTGGTAGWDSSDRPIANTGSPGKGYHNGTGSIGGEGITPPIDLNTGVQGHGGNSCQVGHNGCVYISWGN